MLQIMFRVKSKAAKLKKRGREAPAVVRGGSAKSASPMVGRKNSYLKKLAIF